MPFRSFLFLLSLVLGNGDIASLKDRILMEGVFKAGIKDTHAVVADSDIWKGDKTTGAIVKGKVKKIYKSLQITWDTGATEDLPQESIGLTVQQPFLIANYISGSRVVDFNPVSTYVYDLKGSGKTLDTDLFTFFDGTTVPYWKAEVQAMIDGNTGPSAINYAHNTAFPKDGLLAAKKTGTQTTYIELIIKSLYPNKFSTIEVGARSVRYRGPKPSDPPRADDPKGFFDSDVVFSDVAHIDVSNLAAWKNSVTGVQWGFPVLDLSQVAKLSDHLKTYMYFNIWFPLKNYENCPLGLLDYHFVKGRNAADAEFSTPSRRNRWYSPSTMDVGDAIVFDGAFSIIHSALKPVKWAATADKSPNLRESIELRVRAKCVVEPCYNWAQVWAPLAA